MVNEYTNTFDIRVHLNDFQGVAVFFYNLSFVKRFIKTYFSVFIESLSYLHNKNLNCYGKLMQT